MNELNKIIAVFPFVMIEQKNGKIYHLKEHWKYLNWKQHAERAFVCNGSISNNRYEYLTEPFRKLRRTKF